MKYPMISNWLTFRRTSGVEYEAYDHLNDEYYSMGRNAAAFAKKLDGKTDPYKINIGLSEEEADEMLRCLKMHKLLRKGRMQHSLRGTWLYTLWRPRRTAGLRIFALLVNCLLLVTWLPVLIFGVMAFCTGDITLGSGVCVAGSLLGFAAAVFLHELAHAFAAISCRHRVFEMGIGIQNYVLPFAYTGIERARTCGWKRLQIDAAGIEANLLQTGLCLLLCAGFPQHGDFFFAAMLSSTGLAVVNLLCLEGLDGQKILFDLLGIADGEDFIEAAETVIRSGKLRRQLRRTGFPGHGQILLSYILCITTKVGYPLLLLINIGGVILWLR